MSKSHFRACVTHCTPDRFRGSRLTWLGLGVGVLVLVGILVWSAMALIGWFWGQAQNLSGMAPEAVRGAAREVLAQAENLVPGTRGVLDQLTASVPDARDALDKVSEAVPGTRDVLDKFVPSRPSGATEQRDVSGQDLGPVTRFPGLARTRWQQTRESATVEYEGRSDYVKVLDHYAKGFVSAGFAQTVWSSSQEAETHEYTGSGGRFSLKIARLSGGKVSLRIESVQP